MDMDMFVIEDIVLRMYLGRVLKLVERGVE